MGERAKSPPSGWEAADAIPARTKRPSAMVRGVSWRIATFLILVATLNSWVRRDPGIVAAT